MDERGSTTSVIIAVVVVAVVVVGVSLYFLSNFGGDNLGSGPITFTYSPLEENLIDSITPLGNLNPPGHTFPTDHIYLNLSEGQDAPPYAMIRAPADGIITGIELGVYDRPDGGGTYEDYALDFTYTSTFKGYFYHLNGLDQSILQEAGTLNTDGYTDVHIPVEAGDVLGKIEWIQPYGYGMDWGVIDYDVTLGFTNSDRYEDPCHPPLHSVCPLDYCAEPLKTSLYEKVGRTAEPRGGKIDFDQPGKLVGNWFAEGIDESDPLGDWSNHLAFVYNLYDPTQIKISIGGNLSITGLYSVVGNFPDPADVSIETGKVCYQLQGTPMESGGGQQEGVLIAQVVDTNRIKVDTIEGVQASSDPDFTENAKYYIR